MKDRLERQRELFGPDPVMDVRNRSLEILDWLDTELEPNQDGDKRILVSRTLCAWQLKEIANFIEDIHKENAGLKAEIEELWSK